jgi:hypothetical protein
MTPSYHDLFLLLLLLLLTMTGPAFIMYANNSAKVRLPQAKQQVGENTAAAESTGSSAPSEFVVRSKAFATWGARALENAGTAVYKNTIQYKK